MIKLQVLVHLDIKNKNVSNAGSIWNNKIIRNSEIHNEFAKSKIYYYFFYFFIPL